MQILTSDEIKLLLTNITTMHFNIYQKLSTALYCCLLLLIVMLLTPYHNYKQYWVDGAYQDYEEIDILRDFYGNFFVLNTAQIIFKKLFFEIGLLTVIYSLILVMFKTNKS